MKKIAFFIESLSGGGAEKVLTTLVKNLDRNKFDITVFTVVKTGIYVEEIERYCCLKYMLSEYEGISSRLGKLKYCIDYKQIYKSDPVKIYKKYVKEEYDVEVAFVEGFATKLVAASTNKKSKKICWLHTDMENNVYADSSYKSIEEERKVYQKFDTIVGVSESVKYVFEKKFKLSDSVKVIYNPVDVTEIYKKVNLGIKIKKESSLDIITLGRLEKQKGYDRLIKALGKIESDQYHLWILGEGTERKHLENLIKENNLEKKVELVGFQKNPYVWLEAADAFICTSRAEGYSLVIAEAMLLEKPILSVDCAGPNELLNFGEYGVLIPNTDEEIEKMLFRLINRKIDLKRYELLSKKRKSFFEIDSIIKQVEQLLGE